ncbi:hypothetical protein PC120_g8260 [Phytophthora cactorum]|nr:hypothetical protein PC120_g8260 [Phytophthora cactorum]
MLLEKPEDVKHENSSGTVCAIYGVDAHPTLQLFATAGGDNTVKVWSLQTPLEEGIATFELLATLANHQQAVNCVRWAGHGRYLASGSDDQLVLLYELQAGAPAPVPFGSNARPNKQNWVRCSTLERHTMDVADVAWSPDDRMLATCSIDNTILIWDVGVGTLSEVMTQPLQTLTGHNGWVKGVAWDPVGKYLSSAGEDKTVRMWKVADWQQSDVVTEPFEGCASTSHFRRLSWSPDGSVLCATHAFSSKKNIASLLNRGSWTNDLKFVGHQGVVTSARFNPKLLVTKADPEKEFACCAVGGEDATVSIWLAHLARPLAVIKDCFDSSVTDLTWSSSQSLLLACSLDGSICCFQFAGDEIGTPISDVQQSKLLQAKYGSRAGITLASTLVENPIQLQLEEKSTTSPRLAVSRTAGTNAAPVLTHTTNTLIPKKKKKLGTQASSAPQNKPPAGTSTSDKKRIAPVLLQTDAQSSANNPASSHNNIRNILGPTIASPTASDVTLLDSRMASTSGKEVSVVPDTNNSAKLQASSELSPSETTGPTHKEKEKSVASKTTDIQSKPTKMEVKKNGVDGNSLKRKRESERPPIHTTTVVAKSREVVARPPKLLNESSAGVARGGQLLPEFPFRLQFSVEIETSTESNPANNDRTGSGLISSKAVVEVTVHNLKNPQPEEIIELGPVYSTIKCFEGSEVKWIDRILGRVVCAVGNASYCAIGVRNGDLLVLNNSGRRLFPSIALGSAISIMECSASESPYLLVILATGDLKIWNLAERKLVLSSSIEAITNITPEDHRKLTLLRCQVTTKGLPLITFAESNADTKGNSSLLSYTFDTGMSSWMRVADDSFVFSDFASALPTDAVTVKSVPIGPLRRLQNASGYGRTQRGIASAMLSGMSDPLMQRNVTRSHLEHQVAAAIVLKSSAEYRYWIQAYARFLTHDEDVTRLDDLCAEMMGPFHAPSSLIATDGKNPNSDEGSEWEPMVLDAVKRDVLKLHILPTIAANRALQRVVTNNGDLSVATTSGIMKLHPNAWINARIRRPRDSSADTSEAVLYSTVAAVHRYRPEPSPETAAPIVEATRSSRIQSPCVWEPVSYGAWAQIHICAEIDADARFRIVVWILESGAVVVNDILDISCRWWQNACDNRTFRRLTGGDGCTYGFQFRSATEATECSRIVDHVLTNPGVLKVVRKLIRAKVDLQGLVMAWQGFGLHSSHLPSRTSHVQPETTPPPSSCSQQRAKQLTIYPKHQDEATSSQEQQQQEAEATSKKSKNPNAFLGPEDHSSLACEGGNNQVDEDVNEVPTSPVVLLEAGSIMDMESQYTKRLSGDWISRPYKTQGEIHITYDVKHARYEGLPDAWRTLNHQFGLPLEKVPKRDVKGYEAKLPAVLEMMKTCFLAHNGARTEGVFRLAPDKEEYNAIKAAINDGSFEDCSDVHIMASLIKGWFRELPISLFNMLPEQQIALTCQLVDPEPEVVLQSLTALPPLHQSVVLWLLDLLNEVVKHEHENKMTAKSMAIVMVPNLLRVENPDAAVVVAVYRQASDFMQLLLHARLQQS